MSGEHQGGEGQRMELEDREARVQRATFYEAQGFRWGWAFLLAAGVSFGVAVCRALQWSPRVLWPVALGNILSFASAEALRLRDDKKRLLAEMDMESSGLVQDLCHRCERRYRRLALAHAASALFVAAYYGARLLRGLTLAGQGVPAVLLCFALIPLTAFAYWRSCR